MWLGNSALDFFCRPAIIHPVALTLGADKLATWRTQVANINQAELARRLGVPASTVLRWEAGTWRPNRIHRAAIEAITKRHVLDADWISDEERAKQRQAIERVRESMKADDPPETGPEAA